MRQRGVMRPCLRRAPGFALALACGAMLGVAGPAAAQGDSSPPVQVDLLGLNPVGDSPLSGLAYLHERPGRLRAHVAIADAREPAPDALEEVTFTFDRARCGAPRGRGSELAAERVPGRGLEYTGSADASGGTLSRSRSLGYVEDENRDGDFDDPGELKACGNVRHVRGEGSVAELAPAADSEISGLAVASRRSGRIDVRAVLTMLNNKNPELTRVVAARGRCGAPAGRTLELFGKTNEYDLVANIRTRSPAVVMQRARSLRVVTDLNGDGRDDPAACGLFADPHSPVGTDD